MITVSNLKDLLEKEFVGFRIDIEKQMASLETNIYLTLKSTIDFRCPPDIFAQHIDKLKDIVLNLPFVQKEIELKEFVINELKGELHERKSEMSDLMRYKHYYDLHSLLVKPDKIIITPSIPR